MPIVAHSRFINFYGEPNARLSRDQNVVKAVPQTTSTAIRILCLPLFGEHRCYLQELKKLWVDDYVYTEHWNKFVILCQSRWKEALYGVSYLNHLSDRYTDLTETNTLKQRFQHPYCMFFFEALYYNY